MSLARAACVRPGDVRVRTASSRSGRDTQVVGSLGLPACNPLVFALLREGLAGPLLLAASYASADRAKLETRRRRGRLRRVLSRRIQKPAFDEASERGRHPLDNDFFGVGAPPARRREDRVRSPQVDELPVARRQARVARIRRVRRSAVRGGQVRKGAFANASSRSIERVGNTSRGRAVEIPPRRLHLGQPGALHRGIKTVEPRTVGRVERFARRS